MGLIYAGSSTIVYSFDLCRDIILYMCTDGDQRRDALLLHLLLFP
ncbi:MAG: hypothetical protein ACREC0_08665 [Methylocella sp.]